MKTWRLAAAAACLTVLVLPFCAAGQVAVALGAGGVAASSVSRPGMTTGAAGYCKTDSGVTVVVDFSDLGGGIVIRCAPAPVNTGLAALQKAGFAPEGTQQDGLAYICRLAGRPAADEPLDIDGNPDYTEQCVRTPPASAYWGYWTAPNGGEWTYSNTGASSHHPIAGGFEGWSFSLNFSNDPPAVAATRPGSATTSPAPTTPPQHSASVSAPTTSSAPARPPGETTAPVSSSPPVVTPSARPNGNGHAARIHGRRRSADGAKNSGTPPGSSPVDPLEGGQASDGSVVSGELPTDGSAAQQAGSALPTLIALGLITVVAAGVGFTAWRRSRRA